MTGEHQSFLSRYWLPIVTVAFVTLLAVALFPRAAPPPPPAPEPEARPITTSGDARDVALSPDGSRVAYLAEGGTMLMVRQLSGGPAIELARSGISLGPPRWHPDGAVLLYGCPLPRALCRVATAGGDVDTVVVQPGVGITAYDFAPDGSYLVATAVGPWIYRGSRPASLALVGSDSVTAEGSLADLRGEVEWIVGVAAAPEGTDLAYRAVGYDGRGVIARTKAGAAPRQTLQSDLREGYNLGSATSGRLVWAATDSLFYSRRVGGRRAIAHISAYARGSQPVDVVAGLPENLSFDLSRDGAVLVYAGGGSRRRLHLVQAGGSAEAAALTPREPTWSYGSPAISPQGDVVAYVGTSPTGESDVYLRPLGGGPERRITSDRRPKRGLAWSPAGGRIAFLSETGRGPWLMTVDTGSGRLRRLGDAPAHPYGQPDWSPDGRHVLYSMLEGGGLALVEAAPSGRVTRVGAAGNGSLHAVFSPDGMRIAAARPGPDDRGIWIIELDGGGARLTNGPDRPLRWTAGGEIYFVRQDLPYRGSAVLRQPVIGRSTPPTQAWGLPLPCDVAEVTLSLDAQFLICAVDEFTSDAWVRDEAEPR